MKVPEISLYVKADFSEWAKSVMIGVKRLKRV